MSKYAICNVSIAPIRREPKDQAEIVSQLLFCEKVRVLEHKKKWCLIEQDFDDYKGYVDPKQLHWVTEEEYNQIQNKHFTAESFSLLVENQQPSTLALATPLPKLNNNTIQLRNRNLIFLGKSMPVQQNNRNKIVDFAKLYLNVPYLWGGKSNFGIDCSGLVQQVYKVFGHALPRDAYLQAGIGEVLSFVNEAQPADLAFFDNEEGKIIHVGIVLENQKIIHAHGKVRIDLLDSNGIFNQDTESYSHQLRFVRTLF